MFLDAEKLGWANDPLPASTLAVEHDRGMPGEHLELRSLSGDHALAVQEKLAERQTGPRVVSGAPEVDRAETEARYVAGNLVPVERSLALPLTD